MPDSGGITKSASGSLGDIVWLKEALNTISTRLLRLEDAVSGFKDNCRDRHNHVDERIITTAKNIVDRLEKQNSVQNERLMKLESDIIGTRARQAVIIFIICTTIAVLSFLSTISWFRGSTLDQFTKQIEQMRAVDQEYYQRIQDLKKKLNGQHGPEKSSKSVYE